MQVGADISRFNRTRARPATTVAPFLCLLLLLVCSRPALAQMRGLARRPSLSNGTTYMQQSFGRVGGWLGDTTSPSRSSRNLTNSYADMSKSLGGRYGAGRRSYRRPGMGYQGFNSPYDPQGGAQSLASKSRMSTPVIPPNGLGTAGLSRPLLGKSLAGLMLRSTLQEQGKAIQTLKGPNPLKLTADYLNWLSPEAANDFSANDSTTLYAPVVAADAKTETEADSGVRLTLEQLVDNHLTARRNAYMQRGWTALSNGEYLDALRTFNLAENASLDAPEERAYVKLVMVYAGIAAGQYSSAGECLAWLLTPNPRTGRAQYPDVLNRIFDENRVSTIGQLYVTPEEAAARGPGWVDPDYLQHNQQIEAMAAQSPDSAAARALLAMVEWGRGRRSNAILEAKKIEANGGRLGGLAQLLQDAELMHRPQFADSTSNELASPVPIPAGTQPSP